MTRALPRRVAIVTPVVHSGDAVGTDTIEMAAALEVLGVEVELFAESVRGVARRFQRTARAPTFAHREDDALIYHFSYGWPGAEPLLARARCRRVVKYHNVTPPEFFEPYSNAFTQACREGRRAIGRVVALGCELYLGDSGYNLEELVAAGLPRERGGVLSPFNRIEALLAREADLAFLDRHGFRCETQVLMVGRLAPNKGHLALLDGFAAYRARHDQTARLLVAGKRDARLSQYAAEVDAHVDRLGLRGSVEFLGDLTESELKAAYLSADVLAMASEHEGFCVPLVEAMAVGVPVVCGTATALPETLGDAGLLVDVRNPGWFAEALHRAVHDDAVRAAMRELGRARHAAAFSTPVIARRLEQVLERVA